MARDLIAEQRQWKSKINALAAEMDLMSEKDSPTPGDLERVARLGRGLERARDEYDRVSDEIRFQAVNGGPGIIAVRGVPGDYPEPTRRSGERDQALRQIDRSNSAGYLADHAAERATELVERNGTARDQSLAARWVTIAGDDHYRTAFAKLLTDPTRGHLLWTEPEREAYQRVAELQSEMRAMSVGAGASGGFMVPVSLDPAINLTSAGSINPLRRISRVVQTVTSQWKGLSSAGVTAEWLAADNTVREAADASPTIAETNIPVFLADAFVPYSFEVGADAVDFLTELTKLLVDGYDQLTATGYTTGSGVGQPTGIITALAGGSSVVASGTADTFAKGDVYNVQNQLPARFSANAQWCAHIATINAMSQFESAAGARLFPEIGDGRLLNKPLNELSNMDGVVDATQNNFLLLYGSFENFVVVDRVGASLEIIPNLVGANRRPSGQRGALLWARTGSDSLVDNAFRLLNC